MRMELGMATPARIAQSTSGYVSGAKEFPAGLRVLVVDDDQTTLKILEVMLQRCRYVVTTCGKATTALDMLRENKNNFDLVISDVHMPDMNGFKLLELVGLEMDLPVIMMSVDGDANNVMKGVTHGACDYLMKPVRIEELRNIWQHVVRKKKNGAKEHEPVSSQEHEKQKRRVDDCEHTTLSKKRKDVKEEEEDVDQDSEDPSSLKKPRVVWSVDLHQQFVNAVNQLSIDKAVPKKILELMDVPGLTRENVASHLQKYRLYLKRISVQQQSLSYGGGTTESGGDVRPLAATTAFAIQPLAEPAVLGRLGTTASSALDSTSLLQFSGVQGGPFIRPRLPSPVFTPQASSYLPAFSGGYQLDPASQQVSSSYGQVSPQLAHSSEDAGPLAPLQQQVVPNTGRHHSLGGNLGVGGLSGTFQVSQAGSPLMLQLLQHRQQQYVQNQGLNMGLTGLGQQPQQQQQQQQRIVSNEINLGTTVASPSEVGYSSLSGIMRSSPLVTDASKAGGLVGVVEGNLPHASLPAVPLATPPVVTFETSDFGAKLPAALNPTANLSNVNSGSYGGMAFRMGGGWQDLAQVAVSPRYSQSVVSQNFNNAAENISDNNNHNNAHNNNNNNANSGNIDELARRESESTADSSFKPKLDAISESLLTATRLGLESQTPASDDLLSFYLKQQQQEELCYQDNDLGFDGYVPDNLYVK